MINIIRQLLDWIYRKKCYFCHKPVNTGLMCQNCYEEIELNPTDAIKTVKGVKVYSASSYKGNLKKLIRGLKYHKKNELAKPIAELLYAYWQELNIEGEFEIVPIPLYPKRQKERGYNHVLLIAEEFSKLTGFSINNDIVKRIKDTKPQYRLSKQERRENLSGAFKINPEKYQNTKILLMDDICTTGTTLGELIYAFKAHNIKDLYAIVGANPQSLYNN